MIVKPSAPPADDEAYAAAPQPDFPLAGGSATRAAVAAVAPAHHPAAGSLPMAPNVNEPSEEMTDQCPPPPPLPPVTSRAFACFSRARAAALDVPMPCVAPAV